MIREEQALLDYVELVTGVRPRLDGPPPNTSTAPLEFIDIGDELEDFRSDGDVLDVGHG